MQLEIQTVVEAHRQGLVLRLGHPVLPADNVHRVVIGNHNALEAPFLLEDVIQETAVAGSRNAVHRVVGTHDTAGPAFLDAGAEGLQVHFPEFPP